jgi:hypothetical protein
MMTRIKVVTRKPKFADSNVGNAAETEIESVKDIDHEDDNDRRWLAKHTYWAMRSNHSITLYPVRGGQS